METDEMELDTIGDRKTALFVIISDTPRCSLGAFATFVRLPAIRSLTASSV